MDETLVSAFRQTARRSGASLALRFEGQEYTHGGLDVLSDHLAADLCQRGIRPGDRVGVFLPNGPALVIAHLAIGKAGAIRLCLNPAYAPDELGVLLQDATPSALFTDPKGQGTVAATGWQGLVILAAENPMRFGAGTSAPPDITLESSTPALMAYTSGTTGRPKGAVLTHGNLLSNIQTLTRLWRWTPGDRLALALPMFHMHGLGLGLHGTLLTGSSMILHRKFDAEKVFDAIEQERCTMFMGVPTMYEKMLQHDGTAPDLSSMRLFISGSAPLATTTWHRFKERFGFEILERYGLTETVMNTSNPCDGARKPGSVGLPLEGVSILLAGATPEHPDGEICVKGPNIFVGYWNRPEATADVFDADGYFHTGDVGRFDTDGYLTISGRIKELIISGGFNVYPREVEERLSAHPDVAECAVAGFPDPIWGERVAAFVVPAGGAQLTEAAVREYALAHMAAYKVPKRIHLVAALPRNAMGKLSRKELREPEA